MKIFVKLARAAFKPFLIIVALAIEIDVVRPI